MTKPTDCVDAAHGGYRCVVSDNTGILLRPDPTKQASTLEGDPDLLARCGSLAGGACARGPEGLPVLFFSDVHDLQSEALETWHRYDVFEVPQMGGPLCPDPQNGRPCGRGVGGRRSVLSRRAPITRHRL